MDNCIHCGKQLYGLRLCFDCGETINKIEDALSFIKSRDMNKQLVRKLYRQAKINQVLDKL